MSLPKPEKKKKEPQPLFTDADFETIVTDDVQKRDSFPATATSKGTPLFTDEDFADIKKNDGLGGFVTDSPIKLPSDSPLPSPEKETPSSFLSKDIDNYLQFKSTDQLPAWMPQSLAQTPSLTPEPEQKRQIKEKILSNPEELSKYIDNRFSEITSEINQYNQKRSEELDKIKVQGGDYFKEGNDYAEIGKLIKEKEDSLNALRNNAAMLSSAIRIQKYLPEPEKFNPEELGRDIVRDSSPDLEAKFELAEKNGMTLPGIQRADLQRLGIDAMKSYISNYAMPSQADMDTATKRLAFIENQLASDPRNEKLKAERDTLQSSLSEANTIRNIGIQVDEYEKSFDEKNFELTWNRVKEKFGAFLHKRGDSGVFGHSPEKLLRYVDDPELGLSEAEKKVAKQYGIPLEGKLIGTDIPGSGLVRSFKNAVEQSATGAYNTMSKFLGDQFRKVGVDVGRTESEQAFDLLNAEVSGTRFSPVGENQRSKAILNALNEKEAAGETLTTEEKSRKIEIQKYVDIRDNWDKVYDLTGNMTGQVATIALASRGLGAMGGVFSKAASSLGAGAAGLTSAAAGTILRNELGGLFLSSYLVAKDNYDMQAIDLMPNENQAAQREAYSNLMTGFEAATELIFRDTKVLPSFTKSLSPVAAKSVARMINGEITREAARAEVNSWIKNYVRTAGKEFVTSVAENSTEEAAIDVLQGITNAAFGIEDFDVYKTGQKAINTFATTAIGSGVIGAMSGHNAYSRRNNQNSFLKSSIGNMAVNPAEYLAAVEDLQLSGEITQQEANDKIRIIKSANKFLGELPSKRQVEVVNANGDKVIEERGFDRPESISYILHRINEDNLNEKLQATTDPIDQAQLKKEIDNSVKIRKGIYDGSIGVTPDITPVTDNPKVAEETGILLAGNAKPVDLVGTPFSKQEATQEISLNEKEQAAIEGLQGKDFSNSPIKPYTDVIQNPDATVADKKEALKGLSDQLTAKGTEILVGEALGKEADLIYDLEYEPAQESEAIQAVTGNKEVQNPLLAAYKNKKIQEAEKFDKAASEKGISVVRPGAVASPQVVEKTPPSTGAGKRVSVILPEQNQAPDVVAPVSEEVAEVSRIIEEELAQNGITEKQQVRDLFKEELGSSYDEALVDQAFEIYENKIKNEQAGKRIQPANEGVAESVQSEESESKKQTPKKAVPRKTESGSEGRAETTTPVLKIGDNVQWVSQGVDQFEEPRKVTSISEDSQFVFVEGSSTGIPIGQTIKINKNATKQQSGPVHPESKQEQAKRASDSDMPKGDRDKLQDREAPKKERKKLKTIEDVDAELRDLFALDKLQSIPVGKNKMPIAEYIAKATAILKQLYPNATITIYDSAQEYYNKEGRPVGSMGVFHPKEGRLALNLELIAKNGAANTIFHEVIHPIVDEAILSKEGALDSAWEQLMELKDAPGMMAVFKHMLAYEGRSINVQRVEGITEFLTQVAEGNIDVSDMPKSLATKIIELINEIFEKLGIDKRIGTANDLSVLSKAVKEAFQTADASSISAALGNRESVSGESMDALSAAEQEAAIKDLISRSEGIDQNQLKAKIKQYTGWSDAKIDGLFSKPKTSSPPSAAQLNLAFDDKSILNRLVSGSNLPQSIKDNISKNGLKYQPQKQAEARRMSAYIIDTYGIDVALQQAKANMYHGDVNSAIFATSLDSLYEQERNATTPQQKFDLANKYADIASDYQNAAEGSGRFISFIYDFYRKSPAGIVLSVQKQFQRQQDQWFQGRDQNAKEAFDSFINTVEGKEIFEEAVKEANKKQPRKRIFTDENEAKIKKFFSKLKINTKTTTGSYLVPPQIFNAAIDIIEAAVIAGNSIGKAIESGIEYINKNHKSAWDVAGFKKDISSSFKNQNIQRVLTEEDKAKILKKWDKKLSGLDEDSKKKLLNKAFIELMELGALSYDRFKQMYAEAAGLPQMTPELSQKLGDLANAINAPDALKDDLAENPTPQKIKEYREAISEAETASRELNELIAKEKHWFNTFLTVMRLNLLGSVSLVGNITYNVAAAPVRFFANATHTAIDYALAGVQITSDKIFGTDLYKNRPLYNVFRIQGAYFRGFWYGTKKAVEQFITGVSNRDYFQKEILQNIRPLYSSKRLYRALTGKEKLSLNAALNSFIEAFPTGGWSANFIARALNLGDKPFRFAAEYAKAEELAIKKGLKGINREAFILFPDEDSAEVIQSHGEKITFQQKNVVTAALDSGGRAINNAIKNKGMAPKVLYGVARGLGYATQPFLNTPLNVANEFIHYAFPPLSLYQAGKAMVEGDSERAKEYVSKAVVGLSLQAAATQLIAAGLMVAGSDDDEAPKERRGIQEYHRQGQLNITGLKRWLSGGSSESQHGDIFVDVNYWGFMGMMLSAKASQYKKSSKEDIQQQNMVTDMVGMLPAALRTGITDGVFRGTGALLNAYSMGGRYTDYWLLGMLGTIEGSFLPNFLRSFSLASDKYKRDTRDITFTQEAFNDLKNKMFLGTDLPIKRNIWGDKIESAPKDQNAYVYYMFGINKKNPVDTEKFGYPLYDYYTKTKDADVFPPSVYRTLNDKELNARQYEKLVELIGSHRKQLVGAFINTPEFEVAKNSTAEGVKLTDQLEDIYKTGRDIGVSEFLNIYPEFQK